MMRVWGTYVKIRRIGKVVTNLRPASSREYVKLPVKMCEIIQDENDNKNNDKLQNLIGQTFVVRASCLSWSSIFPSSTIDQCFG
eukprot:TRINITY_DN2141_c0_g1_i1.p1 TRINITY_DN2141_c0_g1~~TRINITY_DN2141_c0_g1_i1.p1  ORF type:complete len:84 (+),score=8.51 TRINITY_DN2141_c0_g1_i1:514-765(+)